MRRLVPAAVVICLGIVPLFAGEIRLRAQFVSGPDRCEWASPGLMRCSLPPGREAVLLLEARAEPGEWVELEASGLPPWARFSPARGLGVAEAPCVLIPPSPFPPTAIVFTARTGSGLDAALALELIPGAPGATYPPSPEVAPTEIPWEEGHRLTWDDFRGTPPPGGDGGAAEIAYEIRYRCVYEAVPAGNGFRARTVELAVELVMHPDRSWVRPWARTPEVLRHEQGHFDLAEVYRRLLAAALPGLSALGGTPGEAIARLKALIADAFEGMKARLDRAQALYDAATSHGKDTEAQREWEERIARWLQDPRLAP